MAKTVSINYLATRRNLAKAELIKSGVPALMAEVKATTLAKVCYVKGMARAEFMKNIRNGADC